MKLLLDTHIFLWLISGDRRLSEPMMSDILDTRNMVYMSVISIWEASVKYQLGRLSLPEPPWTYLPEQRERHQIASLTLGEPDVAQISNLPSIHRDPFDRMLICQALARQLTIVTADDMILNYPVRTY